ncbi:MAG: hypothetical protein WKG07_11360 [Hymenobacter sp.]
MLPGRGATRRPRDCAADAPGRLQRVGGVGHGQLGRRALAVQIKVVGERGAGPPRA